MAVQAVNFRKRIQNLQSELHESRSMEKRMYHLNSYQPLDYEKFSPVFTPNRIEESTEE